MILNQLWKYKQAIEFFNIAYQLFSNWKINILNDKWISLIKLNNFVEAENNFIEAIKLYNNNLSEIFQSLWILYFQQKKFKKALEFVNKSIEYNNSNILA